MNKDLKAGDVIENVQLAPLGEYPAVTTNGKRVDQVCDNKAYDEVARVFNEEGREVQVDFDHKSEVTDNTVAAGWIVSVRSDPVRGLLGDIRVSGSGAKALNELDYRFASAAFELAGDGRPQKLLSLALTNRPNMQDIEKVYNCQTGKVENLSTGEEQDMTLEIKQALGLPEDATDAVVLNGIQTLNGKLKEYMDKEKAAEADAAVSGLPEEVRGSFKQLYADNPEAAKTVINSVAAWMQKAAEKKEEEAKEQKPEVEQPEKVCNSKEAEKPALDSKAAWAAYNSLPQAQKLAYAKEHKAELTA